MKNGFTLSEVLVTLGIIGVVAALTLPSVITNYQKQATASKLKKAYVNLQNALQLSINDNGDMSTWDFSQGSEHTGAESGEFFNKYIAPYYDGLKNPKLYNLWVWNINGNNHPAPAFGYLMLKDGTSVGISYKYADYIWVHIDINGKNGPNRFGKDVFLLKIYPQKNKMIFQGQGLTNEKLMEIDAAGYRCRKSTAQYAGGYCGAKIMQDGWKISDDYPW